MKTSYSDDFEDNIRDLLSNLYDYLRLINNPVAQQLSSNLTGSGRMHDVRHTILETIEDLKSENNLQLTSRQNRLYNILLLRYVEEQSTAEVLGQLALSERQYYREHQRAIQTISQFIWEKHYAKGVQASAATSTLIDELDHLQLAAKTKIFYPKEEILAAIAATRVIAEQQRVSLGLNDSSPPVILNVAQPLFRQVVINVLHELIHATRKGGAIVIQVRLHEGVPSIEIRTDNSAIDWQAICDVLQADRILRELMKRLHATVISLAEVEGAGGIALQFDQEIQKILIVDDNPDTISLFNRYLANPPYQLLSTQRESEAMLIAQQTPLMCIILDIMLPEKDGWQILQTYKSHPLTKHIPVLICSVLDMKELAMSLGADGYIKKPPTRDEFLSTLSQWVV